MSHLFSNSRQSMQKLVQNNNSIVFSSLSEFYQPVQSYGFAIKYVVEGAELYELDNEQHLVQAGSYLLCNSAKQGHVQIESRRNVKGICVNIDHDMMLEVVASVCRPDTAYADKELGLFFSTPYFIETQYRDSDTHLGNWMSGLARQAISSDIELNDVGIDQFYWMAENIVCDQLPVFRQLQSIPSMKSATRRELYKRLLRGREFMDAGFRNEIAVQDVAREACMSEYHFFRLFKKMTGLTPHQYLLQKRLAFGKSLLQQQTASVSAIAVDAGFSDVYSFSKAFKKHFGYTPSSLLQK